MPFFNCLMGFRLVLIVHIEGMQRSKFYSDKTCFFEITCWNV